MITIKAYKEKQYYMSKYGEKEYLDGTDGDETLMMAAMLTGKGLVTERELIYETIGENEEEAMALMKKYLVFKEITKAKLVIE